ncbi:hypothetical protein CC80DRAFT_484433 [Byssothecium circinans]|uniref:Metallo-beta-lactamase domain-containing protein n=1 Tax=Byssothecium circinans TaxID=147558 RepID=A0A6A5TBC8_9PLEO|nr:hypothetical protein CC80DRAFT_484433 [Byssothecium circinans]
MKYESGDLAVCFTCGTQFDAPLSSPPDSCRICDDPRQYQPPTGQAWTSLNECSAVQKNKFTTDDADPRIHYITTKPKVAAELPPGLADSTTTRKQLGIGQRSILIQAPTGNVLWDIIAFIDDATVDFVKSKGGLKAIVISHPHFWTTHLEWARIFACPVYLCKEDEEWVNRADEKGVRKWITETRELDEVQGMTAIVAGGHFDGSMMLHWEDKLFIADTMMSVPSGLYHHNRLPGTISFSFMWAYPNMIPLPPNKVHWIWKAIKPFSFVTTYGGFPGQNVTRKDLKAQVLESMKIFLRMAGHEKAAVYEEAL